MALYKIQINPTHRNTFNEVYAEARSRESIDYNNCFVFSNIKGRNGKQRRNLVKPIEPSSVYSIEVVE